MYKSMKNIKMKGDKIMKKYIIILVIAMVSMLTINVNAQNYEFQSTSTMMSSGSSLSSESGFQSADAYYTTTVQHYGSARKSTGFVDWEDDDDDENDPTDPTDPFDPEHMEDPLPVGDGLWVLMAMAVGAALMRKRKAASVER